MSNPETPRPGKKRTRTRKPATIEGKAREVTPERDPHLPSQEARPDADEAAHAPQAAASEAASAPLSETPAPDEQAASLANMPETREAPVSDDEAGVHPAAAENVSSGEAESGQDKPSAAPRPGIVLPVAAGLVGGGLAAVLILWAAGALDGQGLAPPPQTAGLTALESRLSALESRPPATATPSDVSSADIGRLEADIATLREDIAAMRQADGAMDAQGLAEVQQGLAALEERVDSLGSPSRIEETVTAVGERVETLSQSLFSLQRRVTTIEEARSSENGLAAFRAAALLPVLTNIEDAVASGRPASDYADSLRTLGVEDGLIDQLTRPRPSDAAIEAQIGAARDALRADREAAGVADEGFLGRLQNSLSGLVTVRRVDGADAPSPLDPVRAAVRAGDFAEAGARLMAVNGGGAPFATLRDSLAARAELADAVLGLRHRLSEQLEAGR